VEASLLPSKAIRALAKQVVLTAVRREDPVCAELRKEFAVPMLNSWVVVLDGKGETLASWVGDGAGHGCKKGSVDKFPRNLVKWIRISLERTETVQELERRWRRRPQDTDLFEAFAQRLQEMHAYRKLRQHCQEAMANPTLAQTQRDEFRIRAFTAWASDYNHNLSTPKARKQFVREGEILLLELAGHPQAAGLVYALFSRGYADSFDFPAKSAQAIARLERASRQVADGTAVKERIGELAQVRQEWIESRTEALRKYTDGSPKNYFAALLGDAEAAIELCSQPGYSDFPQYREWLQEAKRKMERQRKRPSAR
jgi:hypothetical protein